MLTCSGRTTANGGITALLLPDGRLAAAATTDAGALVVSAPLLREQTLYVRLGDAFAWLCIAGVVLGIAAPRSIPARRLSNGSARRSIPTASSGAATARSGW
jgi:apolipoprotein N-acyltransferase